MSARNTERPDKGDERFTAAGEPFQKDTQQAETNHERSLGGLLRELSGETSHLVRQEIELARTEIAEKLGVLRRNAIYMAVGGALLLVGLFILFTGINRALTLAFGQFMSADVAIWLAPLALAVLLGIVGFSLIQKGKSTIKNDGLAPRRTAQSLKDDGKWLKERMT